MVPQRLLPLGLVLMFLIPVGAGSVATIQTTEDPLRAGGAADPVLAPDETCEEVWVHAVGWACPLDNGLYRITHEDGHVRTTHGADPVVHDSHEAGTMAAHERQPFCAGDHYQHVLYGYHAANGNGFVNHVPTIRKAIREMNWILNEDALESGGVTADYKVLCDQDFRIRVDAFPVFSGSSSFDSVVSAARAAGFNDGNVDYSIFFDGSESGVCGVGHISYDESPGANNANNRGGDYAVTYRGCWTGRTPMHENGHNQGAVQRTAPDSDGAGHCVEGRDIMCYPTSSFLVLCGDRYHFDCDHDTYFDAEPEPDEWLASNWNIGSRVNRFIIFDLVNQDVNQKPVAQFALTVDGHDVSVDASDSFDPDGDTLGYTWDFGDGNTSTGATASHTYAAPGRYAVELWLNDGVGGTAALVQTAVIVPDVEARVENVQFSAEVACAVTYGPVATTDRCRDLGLAPDDVDAFGFEVLPGVTAMRVWVHWSEAEAAQGGRFGAKEMQYTWIFPPGLGSGGGTSPVDVTNEVPSDGDLALEGGYAELSVRVDGESGLVMDQPYHVCVDIMYGGASVPAAPTCFD